MATAKLGNESIKASRDDTETLFKAGKGHLADMRKLVSAPGAVQPRADSFGEQAVELGGVIAALQETSIAPSVKWGPPCVFNS